MFTGIIESLGTIRSIEKERTNVHFFIESLISQELKVDQSVSHNGVCLTVTKVEGNMHRVTAIHETLQKSTLGKLKIGEQVNLERCLLNNGRFDGHLVQGHVDQAGVCLSLQDENGSWIVDFEYEHSSENVTVEKGSIAVDGVSLTCFDSRSNGFKVAIIPYTFEHTNFHQIEPGTLVNLEFDIIGKYVRKWMAK